MTNPEAYNKIADAWSDDRATAPVPELIVELANRLPKGAQVLDAGCGSGVPIARYLDGLGLRVTGFDASAGLLAKARANVPGATFVTADLRHFDTPDRFDAVVAWDSVFHLERSEHDAVIRRLASLVKPGGYVAVTHGGQEGSIEGSMHGQKFTYSSPGPEKLKRMLKSLGFAIIEWQLDSEGNGYLMALAQKLETLSFHPLTPADYPLFARWLGEPHVQRWWVEPATVEHVKKEYGDDADYEKGDRVYVIHAGDKPIGMILSYRIDAWPEDTAHFDMPGGIGVDYFIGEKDFIGRGYGTQLIPQFINEVIKREYPDATGVAADPEVANLASIRILEKAGFKKGPVVPGEYGPDRPEQIMRLAFKRTSP